MKFSKCPICEYDDISDISLYEYSVQKCGKCEYIRVSVEQYSELLYKVMYSLNVGKIKSYINASEFTKESIKEMNRFIKVAELNSFKLNKLKVGKCNVCMSDLSELKNKYYKFFKIYYCIDCNSIYFNKMEFLDFVIFLDKIRRPFNFLRFLKEIFHLR